MRVCTGQSRAQFTLLARPRATSRATDRMYLFYGRLLGLHDAHNAARLKADDDQFRTVTSFISATVCGCVQRRHVFTFVLVG
jgi:hypothetical protein